MSGYELAAVGIAAGLILALAILTVWAIRPDTGIRITRVGWFVERERFPELGEDGEATQQWPRPPGPAG
jgi:hypothetical protein